MAMIQCPECKRDVSSEAISCPWCGYPISSFKQSKKSSAGIVNPKYIFEKIHIKSISKKSGILISVCLIIILVLVALFTPIFLSAKSKKAINSVENCIDALPKEINTYNASAVNDASSSYDSLNNILRLHVSNRSILRKDIEQIDKLSAEKVEELISDIGDITLDDEAKIETATTNYNSLSDHQKSMVSNYKTLQSAQKKLSNLQIADVENQISKIGTVSLDSKSSISQARSSFNELSDEQKKSVKSANVLPIAEAKLNDLIVNDLNTRVATLGNITLDDESEINALVDEYNSLDSTSKDKVTTFATLMNAETQLHTLKLRSLIRLKGIWFDTDSAGGVTVWVNFTNNSDKVANYVRFIVTPYDAVGTELKSFGQYDATTSLEATGPYAKGQGLSGDYWRYLNVWYAGTTASIKCESIEIDYADGSTTTISGGDVATVTY